MIDPTVRPATVADAPELERLEAASRELLVGRRGGPRWLAGHPERGDAWPRAIADDHVLVALIDAVPVGYLVMRRVGDTALVDDVFVDPAARELGFGDELLAEALRIARALGTVRLEAEALPGDRDTKNLYERAGIKARLIVVSVELAADR